MPDSLVTSAVTPSPPPPPNKTTPFGTPHILRRLSNSAVAWSLAFNVLRLSLGIILLPLLLRFLSASDLGMYYLFLNLNAIVLVLDLGFSPTIGRFVNYAMGGAVRLTPHGPSESPGTGSPNYKLLWELLFTARAFYRYLALATVLLLGVVGTVVVGQKASATSWPHLTWIAWIISIIAVGAETYLTFWNTYLRNLNRVVSATRILMWTYSARLLLATLILVCGGGLLSLPLASLSTSFLIGLLSRKACLDALAACPPPKQVNPMAHLRVIWPNSWRLGLYFGGNYFSTNANVLLCSTVLGLKANAQYGLSLQLMNIAGGLAAVWTSVKWPVVGQLIAKRDIVALRTVLWPRLWLLAGTFVIAAAGIVFLAPPLIHFVSRDKQVLPQAWMALLALSVLLDTHCTAWNTLISLWNRLPMLWPSLITNGAALALNVVFIALPHAQPGFLILGPLLAGAVFNFWFWPRYGAGTLELTWSKFLAYGLTKQHQKL